MTEWTEADGAELDVAIYELVRCFDRHRQTCPHYQPCETLARYRVHRETCLVCEGLAPLNHGARCAVHDLFIAHADGCVQCTPCPHIKEAIAAVLDWREARILLSRAHHLRAERDALEAA